MPVRLDPITLTTYAPFAAPHSQHRMARAANPDPPLLLLLATYAKRTDLIPFAGLIRRTPVMSGDLSGAAPPLPISNRTVKRPSANDSRPRARESRSSPDTLCVERQTNAPSVMGRCVLPADKNSERVQESAERKKSEVKLKKRVTTA